MMLLASLPLSFVLASYATAVAEIATDSVLQKRFRAPYGEFDGLTSRQQEQIRYWGAQFAGVKPSDLLPKNCVHRIGRKALVAAGLAPKPFKGVHLWETSREGEQRAMWAESQLYDHFVESKSKSSRIPDEALEKRVHGYYVEHHGAPPQLPSPDRTPPQSPRLIPYVESTPLPGSPPLSKHGIWVHSQGESPPHQKQSLHGHR